MGNDRECPKSWSDDDPMYWSQGDPMTWSADDPRLDGTLLGLSVAGTRFRRVFEAAVLDSWLGRQMYRFCDWLARRLQPAGEE